MELKNSILKTIIFILIAILASISVSALQGAALNNTAFAGFIAPINNSILTGTVTFNFTLNSTNFNGTTKDINISVVNYTMVSVYGGGTITFCTNVTGGAATANVTACTNNTALFEDGLYNVTIHIANQTSALAGTPNSTTALAGVNISIENFGPKIIITSPGNATAEISTHVINNTILLDANFLNREFEINFSLRDNTAAQNRSFFCELHVVKNIGSPTAIGGNAALSSFLLNKTVTFSNATNVTFKVPSRNVLLNGSNSTFQVKCRNSGQSALYNLSFLQTLTVSDIELPFNASKPTFEDINNVKKTKFEYGDKITIKDCTGTDNVDEAVQKNITIKFPSIGFGLSNISLSFEDTLTIGTYTVNCSVSDSSGNIVSNSSDFEIIPKVRGSSAAAVKGPKPVSEGIVGKGSSESVEVTAEGVGRLIYVGGSLKFMVNNEEHSVTVKEIGKDSVALTISSTPFDISLTKGENKDVDVDGDGANDVNVKFNGVFSGKVDITLTVIAQPIKPIETPVEKELTAQERVAEAAKKITTGTNAIWFVIIVVVIIAIVGYLLVSRRK